MTVTVNDPVLPDVKELFDLLVAQPGWSVPPNKGLPARRWCQYGIPVVTCEELAMGVLNLREEDVVPGAPQCGTLQLADLMVVVGRECGDESTNEGSTDIPAAEQNAVYMDADTTVLRDWLDQIEVSPTSPVSFGYAVEGGIAYVTLNVAVRLGW